MKWFFIFCFFQFSCLTLLCQHQYPGTNVRGQLVTWNNWRQQVPLVSAKVDLYVFNPSVQQWQFVATSYSDGFGYFGFNYLPVNNYAFQVNGIKNYNIQVIFIDYRFYSFQNLGTFFY